MQTNPDGAIILSREELYDRVWTTPIVHLAEEFRLSGTGLAKICWRHRVPRPGRGYWAKKARGHAVSTPDLPPMDVAELRTVTIRPERPGALRRATVPPQLEPPEPRIPVGERLVSPHTLVVRTKAALEREKPDKYGLAWAHRDAKALNVTVAPASIGRALRIMDALLKALEARGHSVTVVAHNYERKACTAIATDGDEIRFHLREITRKEDVKPPPKDRWADRYRYVPTGRFVLQIEPWGVGGDGLRRGWTDSKTQVVEDCLHKFVETVEIITERHRERRRLEVVAAERRAAEEKVRLAREEAIREEQARLKRLEADADAWHKSQRVRAYVEAVRSEATARPDGADAGPVQAWLEWASAHADSLDPLTAGKPPPWATSGPPGEPAAPRNP